jgi:TetR/AcrR family transcriptional repressor of uid operon
MMQPPDPKPGLDPETDGRVRDPRRAHILQAAERACAARGVARVRMEEIAAEAQVSKGTLYRHFDSRDELLVAMVIEGFEAGHRVVDAGFPESTDPRSQLAHLLEGLSEVLVLHAPRATLQYAAWGVVARDERLRRRLQSYLAGFFEARGAELRRILRAGQEGGQFRRDADCEAFTAAILALLSGFVFRSTFDAEGAGPDRLRAAFRALVEQGLLEPRLGAGRSGE